MQSGRSESGGPVTQRTQSLAASDTRGKHRIQAELKRLEQEARSLEEELEFLEKTDKASAACNEILINVEMRPDPLLPVYRFLLLYLHCFIAFALVILTIPEIRLYPGFTEQMVL
ncbi:hypothetical protein EZV62_000724 [Acer yangbiense]|uniref:Uncharacterized protein n=1 Tax=Acer yangbiense TaxID=1000413 RepID=A0A5C7ISH9_9ROSI|nr:hypothetical protein EZV62_000724 [Acer yangbiense]